MQLVKAMRKLDYLAKGGEFVYRTPDLSVVFQEPFSEKAKLSATISSLVKEGTLERVTNGVYVYVGPFSPPENILHMIAQALRPADVTVESLESAAAYWGLTTQLTMGTVTAMTTGSGGRYNCSYGNVELVRTNAHGSDLLAESVKVDGGHLPLATKDAVLRHMRTCRRDLTILDNLEDMDIMEESYV